jgi:hypothetical protein
MSRPCVLARACRSPGGADSAANGDAIDVEIAAEQDDPPPRREQPRELIHPTRLTVRSTRTFAARSRAITALLYGGGSNVPSPQVRGDFPDLRCGLGDPLWWPCGLASASKPWACCCCLRSQIVVAGHEHGNAVTLPIHGYNKSLWLNQSRGPVLYR